MDEKDILLHKPEAQELIKKIKDTDNINDYIKYLKLYDQLKIYEWDSAKCGGEDMNKLIKTMYGI